LASFKRKRKRERKEKKERKSDHNSLIVILNGGHRSQLYISLQRSPNQKQKVR
jgi:hypothetical protein